MRSEKIFLLTLSMIKKASPNLKGNEMDKNDKIYIAGHKGLVGSAILRKLTEQGFTNIITRNSSELDLCNQTQTEVF